MRGSHPPHILLYQIAIYGPRYPSGRFFQPDKHGYGLQGGPIHVVSGIIELPKGARVSFPARSEPGILSAKDGVRVLIVFINYIQGLETVR